MEVVWVIMKRKETMNLLARSHGQLTLAVKRMHVIIIVPQNKHHEMGAINEPSIIIPPDQNNSSMFIRSASVLFPRLINVISGHIKTNRLLMKVWNWKSKKSFRSLLSHCDWIVRNVWKSLCAKENNRKSRSASNVSQFSRLASIRKKNVQCDDDGVHVRRIVGTHTLRRRNLSEKRPPKASKRLRNVNVLCPKNKNETKKTDWLCQQMHFSLSTHTLTHMYVDGPALDYSSRSRCFHLPLQRIHSPVRCSAVKKKNRRLSTRKTARSDTHSHSHRRRTKKSHFYSFFLSFVLSFPPPRLTMESFSTWLRNENPLRRRRS